MGIEAYAFARQWSQLVAELDGGVDEASIAVDYVRLFASGVDGALCPPDESFYLASARHGGPAEVAAALRQEYAEMGVASDDELSMELDHVSMELEVMAAACANEADAVEEGDEVRAAAWLVTQRTFLDDHLGSWFPAFAERVSAADADPFYDLTVSAAAAFIHHDLEWVEVLSTAPA